jgi:lipid-binding SYLF domain-containing protein
MPRRDFAAMGAAALLALTIVSDRADAASAATINNEVDTAVTHCYGKVAGCKSAAAKAKGMLVFPEVTKAGLGVGGSYGVGALKVGGKTVGYYSTTSASLGLQAGAEKHSEVIMFLTDAALSEFRSSSGWQAGGDASVTVIDEGNSKNIDTLTDKDPVVAFLYGEKGLMGALSLEGAKISPYTPE